MKTPYVSTALANAFSKKERTTIFVGDCLKLLKKIPNRSIDLIVSSPPYFMGKEYDRSLSVDDFKAAHKLMAPEFARILKPGGSLCWQVGFHVQNKTVLPLEYPVYDIFSAEQELVLRNRIVWTFEHGVHCSERFSGRHETVLWFTKGDKYNFNLDAVRVPQKYPGKKHYKGPRKGEFSGNPLGKNPGDVWNIPNVKANHIEKTLHPCQFPVALVQRLVRALTKKNGLVFDPFCGVASAGVAATIEGRRFLGSELESKYASVGYRRLLAAAEDEIKYRPLEKPVYEPTGREAVAQRPLHFLTGTMHDGKKIRARRQPEKRKNRRTA